MSRILRRHGDHDRALQLAAQRIDEPLSGADADWLDAHLAACDACAADAEGFEADQVLLVGLRAVEVVPPRDLWARTAAAIDAERGAGRPVGGTRPRSWLPLASLGPIAGVAVVAVLVGSTLLSGSKPAPGVAGSPAPFPTAIAMRPGQVALVTRGSDGGLQVLTAGVDEVCPLAAEQCVAAEPSFATSPITGLVAGGSMDAIISPGRDRLVVVQRNVGGSDGVYVVPVRPPTGGGAATIPTSTPDPAATVPVGTSTPAGNEPSAAPTQVPTSTPEAASPSGESTPGGRASSAPPTRAPAASDTPSPEPSPSGSPPPTGSPPPSATPSPSESSTVTPEPVATPEATSTPAPTVEVTPAPDGAIEIAKDVVVVGSIAEYDADGERFAFTARPADGSTGPDVYVWDTSDTRAHAVTGDHRSLFAGWDGRDLLVSHVDRGQPRTIAINARTGEVRAGSEQAGWLPAVSPDGTQAVWWEGDVELESDEVTWTPTKGRLVVGPWPVGSGDVQVLARRAPAAWQVRWSPDGSAVAVWTAGDDEGSGSLNLYALDPDTGLANLAQPLLRDEPAQAGFSLENGRLVYASAGRGSGGGVWVFGWDGGSSGRVRLPGDTEITVIR